MRKLLIVLTLLASVPAFAQDVTVTGSILTTQSLPLQLNGHATATVTVTANTGTSVFETSNNGSNWVSVSCIQLNGSVIAGFEIVLGFSATGSFQCPVGGWKYFHVNKTSGVGVSTMVIRASTGASVTMVIPKGTTLIGATSEIPVDITSSVPIDVNCLTGCSTGSEVSVTDTINALNDTATIALQGRPYVGVTLNNATTFDGWLMMEFSTDGGSTWDERLFHNGDNWVAVDPLPHPVEPIRTYSVATTPADTHVRIRALTYNSGSTSVTLRANYTVDQTPAIVGLHAVQQSPPTALNALNAAIESVVWNQSMGFFLRTGTLVGTLVVEASPDSHDNSTWDQVLFFAGGQWRSSWALTNPNTLGAISVPLTGGYQRVRLRVSAFTSGSVTALVRSSSSTDAIGTIYTGGIAGLGEPFFSTSIGGNDSGTHRTATVDSSGNLHVSATALPLPPGAATSALQTTGNTSLSSIDGKLPAQVDNRVPMTTGVTYLDAASIFVDPVFPMVGLNSAFNWVSPVVDTTAPVGTEQAMYVRNIPSGTQAVSSTTLATSAKQDTLQTAVDAINTKTPALGQALAAASTPVVLTALQVTALTPPAAITGFSTSANQVTELASLASIDTKLTSQATAANQTTENGYLATLAALSKADGSAHVSGDTGVSIMALNTPIPYSTTNTNGTHEPIQISNGAIWVRTSAPTQVLSPNDNPLLQPCNAVRRTNCRR